MLFNEQRGNLRALFAVRARSVHGKAQNEHDEQTKRGQSEHADYVRIAERRKYNVRYQANVSAAKRQRKGDIQREIRFYEHGAVL